MWFVTQRLNPHLAKVKCTVALIANAKPPKRNTGLFEVVALCLNADKKAPAPHPYLLTCDHFWIHREAELPGRSPSLLRLLVIKQFLYFLLRYNLFAYCRDVNANTFRKIDEAILNTPMCEIVKGLVPKSYYSSESYRFHNQLFQYTKQYADHLASAEFNGEIVAAQEVIRSRQMTQPLRLVPLVHARFKKPFEDLVKLISQQVWCSGQNREEKTVWLIRNLTKGTPERIIHELFCIMYHLLNAYLNWVQFNCSQMLIRPLVTEPLTTLEVDLRCTACFKNITERCNKNKRKHIGYLYCMDDRSFLSSCCEAPMVTVPLERDGVSLVVYTVTKHKYGLCRCGELCVLFIGEAPDEILRCDSSTCISSCSAGPSLT